MLCKAFCFGLIGLLMCHAPAAAETDSRPSSPRSSTKRVVWTLVGIGAGFGAGVFLGLHAFDDSINSDRKVWTSAIVGAAAGGLAGGLLSKNLGRAPAVSAKGPRTPRVGVRPAPWTWRRLAMAPADDADDALRRRVGALNDAVPTIR